MAFMVKRWVVRYSLSESLDPCFSQLRFVQEVGGGISHAQHTFDIHLSDGGEIVRDTVIKEIEENAAEPWTFTIEDLAGEETIEHTHIMVRYSLEVSLKRNRARLVLQSAELMSLMTAEVKSKSWDTDGGSLEAPVMEIIEEHGMEAGEVEETAPVPEWAVVRQAYLTDLEFIRARLAPRSANADGEGGYDLWTTDGKTAWFARAQYKAETATVDPLQVLGVEEGNRSAEATVAGGFALDASGVDMVAQEPIGPVNKEGTDDDRGTTGPSFEGLSYRYAPFATEEAVRAYGAGAQGDRNDSHYPIVVKLYGSSKVGDKRLVPPLVVDLSGTGHRVPDAQSGVLRRVVHTVKDGSYLLEVHLERHKTSV